MKQPNNELDAGRRRGLTPRQALVGVRLNGPAHTNGAVPAKPVRLRPGDALTEAQNELEDRVRERTRELTRANGLLQKEIAARRRSDAALRESEERLRLMIEGTRDYAIFLLDTQGRVRTWNGGAELITGFRARQILGRHFSRLYTREDLRRGKPHRLLEAARATGRAEDEGWRVRKDGTRFWASVIITAVYDARHELRGFLKVTRDITERRQAQEVLRSNEKNLADWFDHAPFGLLLVGPKGQLLRVNQAALELFGCALDECLGLPVQKFFADPALAADALARLARGIALQNYRVQVRRKDGIVRHVLIDAGGLRNHGRLAHSRWFVRDISLRVELEREVLVVAENERQRIGRDLHDDLCQQLTGIEFLSQALTTRLSARLPSEAARARDISQMIRQATTHARDLARGLVPVELETRGLAGALQALALRTRKLFQIRCSVRWQANGLPANPALHVHLYRIAQEAVANALKHGRATTVVIRLRQANKRLVLAIQDDGIGLPQKPGQPSGMGLRVMRHRAEAIGGALLIARNPKRGTTVVCSVNDTSGAPFTKTGI